MKIISRILLLLAALLLAGCEQLTQYRLTEQHINQQLQQRVKFSKNIGLPGIADAHITLDNLKSQIGRAEPDKIILTGNARLDLTSLFGNQQVSLSLMLKTQPVFNKQQGAIYLRDLELMQLQASPEKMDTLLNILSPYLNQSLNSYFGQHPVYILNTGHSKKEALAKKYARGIDVRPGEIVIPFNLW